MGFSKCLLGCLRHGTWQAAAHGVWQHTGKLRMYKSVPVCPCTVVSCINALRCGVLYQCTHAVMPDCVVVSVPSACYWWPGGSIHIFTVSRLLLSCSVWLWEIL